MKDIVGRVWFYVLIGTAVGAGIHGYVPENFMASIMGKSAWWSVLLAVLFGVPRVPQGWFGWREGLDDSSLRFVLSFGSNGDIQHLDT